MTTTARQRRHEAVRLLVGRGLLEGLVAGAAMGPFVLVLSGVVGFAADPSSGLSAGDLPDVVVISLVAAIWAAPFGLAGGVLALVAAGVVARWTHDGWTTSPAAWLAPAVVVGGATAVAGVVVGLWVFCLAAVPAAAIAAWRVRRAVARYAARTTAA